MSTDLHALAAELESNCAFVLTWMGGCGKCDRCRAASALREAARREQAMRDLLVAEVEEYAERLKHTSHRDGLGMGWQEGEHLCREIAGYLRTAPLAGVASPCREPSTGREDSDG